MKRVALIGLVFSGVLSLRADVIADGTFVPKYEEREYEGSLEQTSQEGIIVYREGVEDLILKVTYRGKPQDFAWLIPFPSVPGIFRESKELFAELFAYVEHAIAEESRGGTFGCGKMKESEEAGVEVIARKTVGTYDTTTVRERARGALNKWLSENGYAELKDAEKELEHYRRRGWVFAAIKVREAVAGQEEVDLHPLRFKFRTRKEDEMVYPLKLSVFQKAPLDVNLYIFTDSMINVDYDERGVFTKQFVARYEEGYSRNWSRGQVEGVLPMLYTRRFFLKNYPHERFFLTNIQAVDLRPSEIREWNEDLYILPQYVYLFDPSTWHWPHWLASLGAIVAIVVAFGLFHRWHKRIRRRKEEAP
jgi:hypothetical protein